MAGEVVMIGRNSVMGLVSNLEPHSFSAIVLGDESAVVQGDLVFSTGELLYVPVGTELLGRVVDGLGVPIDGLGEVEHQEFAYVDAKAPGIISRQSVNEAMQTGILAIDSTTAIGRGQRELIIGDRQTGKTTIAIDTILNHRSLEVDDTEKLYCIYVAVGQKRTSVVNMVEKLKSEDAFECVTILGGFSANKQNNLY
jgi:F-type H+/Na+-transporting ATPase subunit alpha